MILRDYLETGIEYRVKNGAKLTPSDILRMIEEKATLYGITVSCREDFISNNLFEGFLGLLKQHCIALYSSEYDKKSTHYVFSMYAEGTYLFITFYKSIWCPHSWGRIMDDIIEELFA